MQLYPQLFCTQAAKWNAFFCGSVLMPIFKPTVDFGESAKLCHWMGAEYVPPIVAMRYNISVVVYTTTISRGIILNHGDESYFWDTSGINIVVPQFGFCALDFCPFKIHC